MNLAFLAVALLVPALVVTVMGTTPAVPAGETTSMVLTLTKVKAAGADPKCTADTLPNRKPLRTTLVPPVAGPVAGVTAEISGGCLGCRVADAGAAVTTVTAAAATSIATARPAGRVKRSQCERNLPMVIPPGDDSPQHGLRTPDCMPLQPDHVLWTAGNYGTRQTNAMRLHAECSHCHRGRTARA